MGKSYEKINRQVFEQLLHKRRYMNDPYTQGEMFDITSHQGNAN